MGLKTITQVKNQKPFLKMDLIVYALVLVLILILFIVFVFTTDDSNLEKIQVYHYASVGSAKLIYEYNFTSQKGEIKDADYKSKIEVTHDGADTLVKFLTNDGHYNLLKISFNSAKIIEADCSKSKECVNNFGAITSERGSIVCTVHNLKVIGVGQMSTYNVSRLNMVKR